MIRHQKSRTDETEEETKIRKEKDIAYKRNKRTSLSEQERVKIKQGKKEKTQLKRNEEKSLEK